MTTALPCTGRAAGSCHGDRDEPGDRFPPLPPRLTVLLGGVDELCVADVAVPDGCPAELDAVGVADDHDRPGEVPSAARAHAACWVSRVGVGSVPAEEVRGRVAGVVVPDADHGAGMVLDDDPGGRQRQSWVTAAERLQPEQGRVGQQPAVDHQDRAAAG